MMSINIVTAATTRAYMVYSPIKKKNRGADRFVASVSANGETQARKICGDSLYRFGKNMLAK